MIDLRRVKRIHLTGIKGVGMTALACCARDLGMTITGSDVAEVFVTDAVLARRKISWQEGFDGERIGQPDLLVTTGAHGGFRNPEVVAAQAKGVTCLSLAEALGLFIGDKETISVCGVGGKSTTSAMIATMLDEAGLNPSYSVGVGQLYPLGDPGRMTKGAYFVAEADEYAVSPGTDDRPRFVFQQPKIVVVTNIEHDHPDIYPDLTSSLKIFRSFLTKVGPDGLVVGCSDNKNVAELVRRGLGVPVQTYGFESGVDWQITNFNSARGKTSFTVRYQGMGFEIQLQVPGRFNGLNAVSALAVGTQLGLPAQKLIEGLRKFIGIQRRFEMIARVGRHWLYDDYAHHPSEIRATILAAKRWWPDHRLVVVFQPHTYTRTKALLKEFTTAFSQADQVLVAEIYASARESEDQYFSTKRLVEEIRPFQPKTAYVKNALSACEWLGENITKPTVVMTMGAGNIYRWHPELKKGLKLAV